MLKIMLAKDSIGLILLLLILGISFLSIFLYINIFIILVLSLVLFMSTIFFIIFFRDPEREIGAGIISPADGKVLTLERTKVITRISIFMTLWNVHVNRAPLSGKVVKIEHSPGRHSPAYKTESERNEKVSIELETEIGKIKLNMIAGIFARRIACYVKVGQQLVKGQRIGIVKFGSRVELYLPAEKIELSVRLGDKVYAGRTTLGVIYS